MDAAQGITSDWHIDALPRGTGGATAFKSYTAESRHIFGCDTYDQPSGRVRGR